MRGKVRVTPVLLLQHLPIDNGNGREISKNLRHLQSHSAKSNDDEGAADKFCFMGPRDCTRWPRNHAEKRMLRACVCICVHGMNSVRNAWLVIQEYLRLARDA